MSKIRSQVENIPNVPERQQISQGDILAGSGGNVYIVSEYDKVVCIATSGPNSDHYLGEEFNGEDHHELEESIGAYMINPKGMVVTITVQ